MAMEISQARTQEKMTKIEGEVKRVSFRGNNDFHIIRVQLPNGGKASATPTTDGLLTVKVTHPNITEGMTLEFHGSYIQDAKYGHQFVAKHANEVLPSTTEGLITYLSSSFFHGIGPVKARKIVKHFKDKTIEIFNTDIDRLLEVTGITEVNLENIKHGWERNKEINEIMQFMMDYGMSAIFAGKVYEFYGQNCVNQIRENPYDLAKNIHGIGFKKSDALALRIGFPEDSPLRIKACIEHILNTAEQEGHCFLYMNQIIEKAEDYLGINMDGNIINMLNELERDGLLCVLRSNSDKDRYYGIRAYRNELYCYEKTKLLASAKHDIDINEPELYAHVKVNLGFEPSEQQWQSVIGILKSGVSVLTGGPGTGKCLKAGTPVLMYDGTKKMVEDILVGDVLMGDDSTPRHVLGTCSGTERMYDIVSNDGKEWGCNESHILSLRFQDSRNTVINGVKYHPGDIIDISIKDYLKLSERKKHHLKQYSTGVEYPKVQTPVEPYLLGLWLGDGTSNLKDGFRVTNVDQEILDYCEEYASVNNLHHEVYVPKTRTPFIKIGNGKKAETSLCPAMKELALANNKHIPSSYLINSKQVRYELLAGLIDSDGHLQISNNTMEVTQKSKQLAYDIYELCLSLGLRTRIRSKQASMLREDGSLYKCEVYRVYICGDIDLIPTRVKRKQARSFHGNRHPLSTSFSVIDKGVGTYYGFEIDGNKRFVLGNYIVTHNTNSTKALVEVLDFIGVEFMLCAPTGRAAKRMREVIGHNALTIHRLLSWDPLTGGFAFNESNQLRTKCVLIDEFSMVDIHLAAALLMAIPDDAMVVFIGDPDQLPPVGAGNYFRDLIESRSVNVFTLTQIFRQGKNSSIVDFSHTINHGEVPNIETPLMDPSIWKEHTTDCLFIDSGFKDASMPRSEIPKWNSLHYGLDVMEMIVKVYKESIPKYYNHPKDIQVLIPMRKGPIGTIEVNKRLQLELNPKRDDLKEITIGENMFRENDKVIQMVNNYNLNVFNGDVGRIVAINHDTGMTHISYGDDRVVAYTRTDMMDVELAYAISIHKSQGSEFDFVIIPIMNSYFRMLYRQLIYTAMTRGKKLVVIIGQRESLNTAIRTLNSTKRQTSLREFFTKEIEPITDASCK